MPPACLTELFFQAVSVLQASRLGVSPSSALSLLTHQGQMALSEFVCLSDEGDCPLLLGVVQSVILTTLVLNAVPRAGHSEQSWT